ncbi:MAG: hypothetical protein IV094_03855 [Vitreoscilla sp.]|nr:hypothetical protein [Vitreoscilla sp.]
MTHAPQRRRDLGEHGFITVSEASGNRLLPDQARTGVPGRPEAVYEAQHVTTLPGPVETGLGVAALQSMAFSGRDHPLLVSIPLEEPRVTRDVGLIRRRGRALTPAAQQQLRLLCGHHGSGSSGQGRPTRRAR